MFQYRVTTMHIVCVCVCSGSYLLDDDKWVGGV